MLSVYKGCASLRFFINCNYLSKKEKEKRKSNPDVEQEFHLVPEMLLLPSGLILTSELLTNGLVQEQSYCRTKRFIEGLFASRNENVLSPKPNIRF
jgi:hypothetical protein